MQKVIRHTSLIIFELIEWLAKVLIKTIGRISGHV